MLAVAAFAIQAAENSVPASADALLQAGLFYGFMGVDIRSQIIECFIPDQQLADDSDAFIAAVKAKDFATVKSIVTKDSQRAQDDAAPCMSNPKYQAVADAYNYQIAVAEKAKNDPDWQLKALKCVKPHLAEIKQLTNDALDQWALGTDEGYYQAGVKLGTVDKYALCAWENSAAFL